jgi:hypothetical protein
MADDPDAVTAVITQSSARAIVFDHDGPGMAFLSPSSSWSNQIKAQCAPRTVQRQSGGELYTFLDHSAARASYGH